MLFGSSINHPSIQTHSVLKETGAGYTSIAYDIISSLCL